MGRMPRNTLRASALLYWVLLGTRTSVAAQPPTALKPSALALDTLLRSPGPPWITGRSAHFVVHVEGSRHAIAPRAILDSLEAAWVNAVGMLGESPASGPAIEVLVTASRTRFPRLLSPQAKGLTTQMPNGGEVIILVANDTVRAYARHEVMHAVSQRTWRPASLGMVWLVEGFATLADGKCQGTTTIAVARDLLHDRPTLSADDVTTHFVQMWETDRGSAYVLASSFVAFILDTRGRDGVRRLWQGTDSLRQSPLVRGQPLDLTASWRAFVDRRAGQASGIDVASFRRFACG